MIVNVEAIAEDAQNSNMIVSPELTVRAGNTRTVEPEAHDMAQVALTLELKLIPPPAWPVGPLKF